MFRPIVFLLLTTAFSAADGQIKIRPSAHTDADAELRALRSVLRGDPQNISLAVHVARQLADKARREGTPQPLSHAMAALAPWWQEAAPHPEVLLLRATIRQCLHEFAPALTDLDALVQLQPRDARAWLTRATVQLVRGNLKASADSCEFLRPLTTPLIHAAALTAAETLQQDTPAAAELERLLSGKPEESPAVQSWACAILAEHLARWGHSQRADEWFREALSLTPDDRSLLAARADFLLSENLAADVIPLLRAHTSDDLLLLRLAMALKALHEPATVQVNVLKEHAAAARALDVALHLREEAMLRLTLLDDPKSALPLAVRNWQIQREPADARLLLIAAAATGKPAEAEPVLEWMKQHDVKAPELVKLAAILTTPAVHPQ